MYSYKFRELINALKKADIKSLMQIYNSNYFAGHPITNFKNTKNPLYFYKQAKKRGDSRPEPEAFN